MPPSIGLIRPAITKQVNAWTRDLSSLFFERSASAKLGIYGANLNVSTWNVECINVHMIIYTLLSVCFSIYFLWLDSPSGLRAPRRGFETTLRHTTLGRTTLDEWSVRRRDSKWQHTTLVRERRQGPWRYSNPQVVSVAVHPTLFI